MSKRPYNLDSTLSILKASCEEALAGRWDRSDDGFEAMLTLIDDAIATLRTANRARAALTLNVRQAAALRKLLAYTHPGERRHFYEEEPEARERHVFHHISVLALACGYVTAKQLKADADNDVEARA